MKLRSPKLAPYSAAQARKQILNAVRRIPRGCVASYGQIACEAGLPGRARLVGRVLAQATDQKLCWHRVLNAQGKISLPQSNPSHAEQKRRLRHEQVVVTATGVSLKKFGWKPRSDAPLLPAD